MSSVNSHPAQEQCHPNAESWPAQDPSTLPQTLLRNCHQGVLDLHAALAGLDRAGTSLTLSLAQALHSTAYKFVGDVLTEKLSAIFSVAVSSSSMSILKEMETMLSELQTSDQQQFAQPSYGQSLCHISLLLTKLKKQYFALCHNKMADLVHSLLCLKGEDQASGEVTKLVLKLGLADGFDPPVKSNTSLPSTPWGSPKTRKTRQDSSKTPPRSGFRIMSLFERKMPPDDKKSSFCVEAQEGKHELKGLQGEEISAVSVTSGNHDGSSYLSNQGSLQCPDHFSYQQGRVSHGGQNNLIQFKSVIEDTTVDHGSFQFLSSKSQLATEEELESVINLLSGVGCGSVSPMQVIPEVVPPQGPMQLTVPQIYRMPSPSCDTQLEELRTQKSQVHRRSEGCLDLSAVGRNMWPQQNQHHHRASLPSVQIFSASGHRSGFETPSPVPSYIRDSPSPNYTPARDPPSPGYFHGDPPSPFRSQCGNTFGVGVRGAQPNMLSPLQWAAGPGCMSGRMSGYDTSINQHGTWPAYGGVSPLSTGTGETSSWAAVQDCSDVSDDSSTEDQFFAVGKDLSHMIGSKNGSSDEDVGNVQHGPKNSWPPPSPHSSTLLTRGVTPDLLEPPELYNAHRPIQMQWSDPLSSRSMWANSPQDINQHKTSQSMQGFGGVR